MDILFTIKKVLGVIISPFPICCFIIFVGLIILFKAKRDLNKIRRAKCFLSIGILLLLLISSPIVSFQLLRPIETVYVKYQDVEQSVDNIIVLGCYNTEDASLPLVANIKPCSLYRVVEAARLARVYPEAEIILSGWQKTKGREYSHPAYMAQLLISLGIDEERIVLKEQNNDTSEEAISLKSIAVGKSNLLVSSASHLKRAVKIFDAQGITVTPVPAEFLAREVGGSFHALFPSGDAINNTQRAFYELLGNIWVWILSVLK